VRLNVQAAITNDLAAFEAVARDLPFFWELGLAAAILAPLVILIHRASRLAVLSAALLLPPIVLLVLFGEARLAYLLPPGIVVALGAWWELIAQLPKWGSRSFGAALLTCLVIDVLVGTQYFAAQRDFYTVLNPALVQGLARLSTISRAGDVIAVSPAPHAWELGWWVEGAGHRSSIYAGSPIFLNFADEKSRNAVANEIFSSDDFEATRRKALEAGAAYLFIDKNWSGYEGWARKGLRGDPGAIVYENESVLIITTSD
jgi:hypothetical protein